MGEESGNFTFSFKGGVLYCPGGFEQVCDVINTMDKVIVHKLVGINSSVVSAICQH